MTTDDLTRLRSLAEHEWAKDVTLDPQTVLALLDAAALGGRYRHALVQVSIHLVNDNVLSAHREIEAALADKLEAREP